MERIYASLPWLDMGQAVDYLGRLTAAPITEALLLPLCEAHDCPVYVDVEGVLGWDSSRSKPAEARGVHRVSSPAEAFSSEGDRTLCTVGPVRWEGDKPTEWKAIHPPIPPQARAPKFKPADIEGLASKLAGEPYSDPLTAYKQVDAWMQSLRIRASKSADGSSLYAVETEYGQPIAMFDSEAHQISNPYFLELESVRDSHAVLHDALELAQSEATIMRKQLEQEREAREAVERRAEIAEAEAKPSHLLAIAALLELLKAPSEFPRPQGMNQEAIKVAILGQFTWRGLSKRNIEDMFAAANKAKADAE